MFRGEDMKYSEKLNGYWEEGYHYYIEIRDGEMTIRDYMRKVQLKTGIAYDAEIAEAGERTVITPENNVLSRTAKGDIFEAIQELAYNNGELEFLYHYTITGDTLYSLKKVDHGPFDHILIRDDEYLDRLQGEWKQWTAGGEGTTLTIRGNRLTWLGKTEYPFHVVSRKSSTDDVDIVPEDLTENSFPGFNSIHIHPDMLTTYLQVFDMSVPMTVFARADMLDKIEIPESAKAEPRSTMMNPDFSGRQNNGFPGFFNRDTSAENHKKARPSFCPNCGTKVEPKDAKFCSGCGQKL